jgi:hypothetical protein
MIKLIVSLAGLFVAGVAWAASQNDRNDDNRTTGFTGSSGLENHQDLSGGTLGI